MSPGGHLVATALACGAVQSLTGSAALTVGVAAGGFLIDVDHVFDYVVFEGQRDLSPAAFLSYYTELRTQRVVLLLHSYELLAVVAALAWITNAAPLWGYLLGAGLHLPLDIVFNGRALARNLMPFYSLAYRWRSGFAATPLLGLPATPPERGFWRSFFAEAFKRELEEPASASARPRRSVAVIGAELAWGERTLHDGPDDPGRELFLADAR